MPVGESLGGGELFCNTVGCHSTSGTYLVMQGNHKIICCFSADGRTLCVDVRGGAPGEDLQWRGYAAPTDARGEGLHAFPEDALADGCGRVECLFLKSDLPDCGGRFVLDGASLLRALPRLGTVCCGEAFEIRNGEGRLRVLDPFSLGELAFLIAQEGDFDFSNSFLRELWALDCGWACFFENVIAEYRQRREVQGNPPLADPVGFSGLDRLFGIYLFGCPSLPVEGGALTARYKNIDRAIALMPLRFQGCSLHEIAKRLARDFRYKVREDFATVLSEAERLFPGVTAELQMLEIQE